jgi:hypothetical protein
MKPLSTEVRKFRKIIIQDGRCPDRGSKRIPLEYKPSALPLSKHVQWKEKYHEKINLEFNITYTCQTNSQNNLNKLRKTYEEKCNLI